MMQLPATNPRKSDRTPARPGLSGLGFVMAPITINYTSLAAELERQGELEAAANALAMAEKVTYLATDAGKVDNYLQGVALYLSDFPAWYAMHKVLRFNGPLTDTPSGRQLYNETLKNLQPTSTLVSSTTSYRKVMAFEFFRDAAKPVTQAEIDKNRLAFGEAGMLPWRPTEQSIPNIILQANFWDAPGMFYPFDYTNARARSVWGSVMSQFYGAMPPPYLLKGQPGYVTYTEQYRVSNNKIALTEYGPALNDLFRDLPVTAKETIAAKKPPYYTAGEADNFFQLKAGTNLQNMIMFCQWIMNGAPPGNPPQYLKQVAPPSSGDVALSVVLGFAGFALAFVGVPAIIGALSVVTQKIVENYQLEKAEEIAKESAKAEAVQIEIAKEQAVIQKQIDAINSEREALQKGEPVKSVLAEQKNVITLAILSLIGAMVI